MARTYPINTLRELADIPEPARSRCLAALPFILNEIDRRRPMLPSLQGNTWTDDGLSEVRINGKL